MVIQIERDSVQIGDMILGVFRGEFRIHRLLQLTETHAIMRGDASEFIEEIPRADIVGRVISFHDDWRGVARRAAGSVRSYP